MICQLLKAQTRICRNILHEFMLYHVEVGEGCHGSPVDGSGLHRLDPQVVGEHQGKDGDSLDIRNIHLGNNTISANKQLINGVLKQVFLGLKSGSGNCVKPSIFCMRIRDTIYMCRELVRL